MKQLRRLNTKIRSISGNLKVTYDITVGTNHPQCDEPPNLIVKFSNYNREAIQNCISIYQIWLSTVSGALIIGRKPFTLIKGYISSDTIDCLLYNQC